MKRTQYFARKTDIMGVWRIKNGVAKWNSRGKSIWEHSVWKPAELYNGAGSNANPCRQISRDKARKLCPKAFRKA